MLLALALPVAGVRYVFSGVGVSEGIWSVFVQKV
jgi:hypothetical protein